MSARNAYGGAAAAGLDVGGVVEVGGGDVVGGIDDDGRTVGDVDGVTEGVTEVDAVGDGVTGATVAEVDGITGATTGGTLEVAPVACPMSKGHIRSDDGAHGSPRARPSPAGKAWKRGAYGVRATGR